MIEHPRYPGYYLDARGRVVSARQSGRLCPRRLTLDDRGRVAVRWRGHTIKIDAAAFAAECRASLATPTPPGSEG